jgi:hypothetical protein
MARAVGCPLSPSSCWCRALRLANGHGPSAGLLLSVLLLVDSWLADWDIGEQPFREALVAALAFKAFAQEVDTRGSTGVLRKDAATAIASFCKGSTRSPWTSGRTQTWTRSPVPRPPTSCGSS